MSEALQKMAGLAAAPYPGSHDYQPLHRSVDRYVRNNICAIVHSHDGDDRIVCQRRTANTGTGHLRNHGSQHRHYIHGMDYDTGLQFQHGEHRVPVFFIALLLIYRKKQRYVGDFLFGVAFMFFAISTLGATGKEMDLSHNQTVIDFFSSFDKDSYLTVFSFLIIGTILTFCMQSSAALMAITMVLCSSGVLPIYMGIALVLGENIGTTITSNIAAMGSQYAGSTRRPRPPLV